MAGLCLRVVRIVVDDALACHCALRATAKSSLCLLLIVVVDGDERERPYDEDGELWREIIGSGFERRCRRSDGPDYLIST